MSEQKRRIAATIDPQIIYLVDGVAEALQKSRSEVMEFLIGSALFEWGVYPDLARNKNKLEAVSDFFKEEGYSVDRRNRLVLRL
jgi:hypothetical protein